MLHVLQHPVFALADGRLSNTGEAISLPKFQNAVGVDERLAPTQPGIVPLEGRALARNEEFVQVESGRHRTLRVMRVDDRERNHDGSRQEDIWYRSFPGSRRISGGILGVPSRG